MNELTDLEKYNELVRLLTINHPRKGFKSNHSSAMEFIRCGIGCNYGGEYYDEVIRAVREPILEFIEANK